MVNLFNKLQDKAATACGKALANVQKRVTRCKKGETSYVSDVIVIIIAIVIGGLLLYGLVRLFKDVILVKLGDKINEFFNAG